MADNNKNKLIPETIDDKKFKIITTIEDDAPSGDINWCTLSFSTPQKLEKLKFFDIRGFKVHTGCNTAELANDDAKKIKEKNKNHDVYLSQLGKTYAWDDATKTDSIEYGDDKLNELEKTRREQIDKIKLMSEQYTNEHKTIYANKLPDRTESARKKNQEKLHKIGKITQKELEMMQETNKSIEDIRDAAEKLNNLKAEIEECYKTDYLDENESIGLKYGCMTIFSPRHIGGLKTLCFKIRGLFQTPSELNRRIRKLKSLYPNDRIYKFEVGKWCVFSENDNADPLEMLKQLNYSMKCYLENLETEKEDFEKRKETLQAKTEQESKLTRAKNRKQKRKEKIQAAKNKKDGLVDKVANDNTPINKQNAPLVDSMGNTADDAAIQNILDYLDEPELRNKFPANNTTTSIVDVN